MPESTKRSSETVNPVSDDLLYAVQPIFFFDNVYRQSRQQEAAATKNGHRDTKDD
ncbi:hypothetical protein NEIMUCOT_05132 [Neisseria mucosa ATCC 25996]|uniref:Uncharacterized protein n=1 Tax=Neisseria mucosa (strain ATCC 25996 / DSM 4631 / NCTC 10774 / M26) TaxID=546266 RepID=D2ZWY4_NEIM2|nr:hypothetical protein NEIMUCOT_05132 [Neisseria mucosa ATCC 25996]